MSPTLDTGAAIRISHESPIVSQRGMRGVVESCLYKTQSTIPQMYGVYVPLLKQVCYFYENELEAVAHAES